jgi:O-antigen/teichoic acid export membrane protein
VTKRASYSVGAGFSALSWATIAVIGVASGIVIARLYGAEVIGQFALVIAPVNAVWLLSSARERPAFVRELAVLEPRAPRATGLFAAVLAFSFSLTVVVTLLALPIIYLVFTGPIDQPDLFVPIAVSLVGYTLVTNTGVNVDAVFSAFRAGRELLLVRVHQTVAFLALAIVCSGVADGVWGLVIATIASATTALVHRVLVVRRFMALRAPRSEVRAGFDTLPAIIRFGLKITPGGLANGMCNEIGTWILGATASVAALGAYSRAAQLTSRLLEVNWRIGEMLFPTLVTRRGDDAGGFDRALVDTLRYGAVALLLPAAVLGGAAESVMSLYGADFVSAATALTVLMILPAITTVGGSLRQALLAVDRPSITSVTAGVKLVVTAAATIVLTLWIGVTGTALGLVSGAAVELGWLVLLTRGYLVQPLRVLWPIRQRIALLFAYAAGFGAARLVVSDLPGTTGLLPALVAGTLCYAAVFAVAGGIGDRDRARARAAAAWLRRRRRMGAATPT